MPAQKRDIQHLERFERIGMVARWKPVHLGHVPVLHALCDRAAHALIGIGSSNRYNVRNPFTLEETSDMIRLVMAERENYTLIPVPDLDDGPRWRLMIIDLFGPLDLFVTANPYVASLLAADYQVIKPVELVPPEKRIAVEGRMVRREMACGGPHTCSGPRSRGGWRDLVPDDVAQYIADRQLDERFRREFGLQTLAQDVLGAQDVPGHWT